MTTFKYILRDMGRLLVHHWVLGLLTLIGLDTPSKGDLAAAKHSLEEITETVSADFIRYLGKDDLIEAIGLPQNALCTACFDGNYTEVPEDLAQSSCKMVLGRY